MRQGYEWHDVRFDPAFNHDVTALRLVERRALYLGSRYEGMAGIDRHGVYHFFNRANDDFTFATKAALAVFLFETRRIVISTVVKES